MASLFTSIDCPPQLDEFVRNGPISLDDLKNSLIALDYQSGTPGWKAVMNPQTPLDKAFQIYTLNLSRFNEYGAEPLPYGKGNDLKWDKRDKAWKLAAEWLNVNTDIIRSDAKDKQKELTKLLPEAIRIQCSHELTPGNLTLFPRETIMQRSVDLHKLTDKLQHVGLNIKIKSAAIALGETISMTNNTELKDLGSLESLLNMSATAQNKENTQLGLF